MSWRPALVVPSVVLLALATGCGQAAPGEAGSGGSGGGTGGSAASVFRARAEAVAASWSANPAASAWRSGLVALQELTIGPADFPSSEAKQAFAQGVYVAANALPTQTRPATVRLADGTTTPVTAVSAAAAFAAMRQMAPTCTPGENLPKATPAPTDAADRPSDRPAESAPLPPELVPTLDGEAGGGASGSTGVGPPTCARLTVTGASLTTATIRTSRGEAAVPAWRFTVKELDRAVLRVALDGSALTPVPQPEPPQFHSPGIVGATELTSGTAAARQLGLTIGIGACDNDPAGLVYETEDTVVVGGTVTPPDAGQICTEQLILHPVTVTLTQPLGDRAVLDVLGGQVLVPRS